MKRSILFCLLISAHSLVLAADTVPEQGLRAEMEGRWDEAARIYQQELAANPAQAALWQRLADIHSRLKQHALAAQDMEQATRLSPREAQLWLKLSRAHAQAGNAPAAFAAAGQAQVLEPDNVDILRARAELAVWVDNRGAAEEAYQHLNRLVPGDPAATLGLARLAAWSGRTDAAVANYKAYLQQRPQDKAAWIDLVKTEGWRGNYPDALDELEQYRTKFGEDRPYLEQKARALAWLGKAAPALAIAEQLLVQTPKDPDVLTTRAIALQAANRPREALADLQTIKTLRPDSKDTADLSRYLTTPQRSSVTLALNYGKDSDQVRIGRMSLTGEYVMNPESRLWLGGDWQHLRADTGSGLENISGAPTASYQGAWLGGQHRFSPMLAGDLRVGGAQSSGGNQFTTYRAGLDVRASDEWSIRPEVDRDLFAVSPRAASLGIKRDGGRLLARWTPDTRYVVDGSVAYDHFSDGNKRWEVNLAPRRAFWRTQDVNIDLGVSGRWFGYQDDLSNGYYDPNLYQRYAVTGFTYWKINDNNGVSLALSLGMHKDNTMNSFKLGGDAVVQGFFGIYDDWYLRVYASILNNVRQNSGAYRGEAVGMALTRRF